MGSGGSLDGDLMKILVTGSSGFVGGALVSFLQGKGHRVIRLVRSQPKPGGGEICWNPEAGTMDRKGLEGLDAVVHLAGEGIVGRWTKKKKEKIRESRVRGTRFLSESLAELKNPPQILVGASAVGFYGDRGDEVLNEKSPPGANFLADVCREWEEAAGPAVKKGIRVVNLRIGMVLHPAGGALAKMLPPFRLGLGGVIGDGRQYVSWISRDDLLGVILFALTNDKLSGPVNAVSPNPVMNREFTRTLGRVLSRPTIFPMPAFAARLVFGKMADELFLASTRVEPMRLKAAGYCFQDPELEGALRRILRREQRLISL